VEKLFLAVVLAPLLILFYRYAIKGKIGTFSTGVGNALFQAHTFLRPTAHNIVEAKKQREENAGEGDDGPRTCHLGLNQTTEKWRSKNHLARPELTENLDSSFDVAIHFVQVSRRNPILLMS